MIRLGIDIGGSAIKAALVDLKTGMLVSETFRVKNSKDTEPEKDLNGIQDILKKLRYDSPIGIGFPGRLRKALVLNAPNLHPRWTGLNLKTFFSEGTGQQVVIRNDADAAALAELHIGNPAIKAAHRTLFLTLGTGIGSALILDGKVWEDTELGHLMVDHRSAEQIGCAAIKNLEKLSWEEWASRLDTVLKTYDFLFSPELFVLGGAISSNLDDFQAFLSFPKDKVIAARLGNDAGIIGAAMATLTLP